MAPVFTRMRKVLGWALLIISIILTLVSIVVASMGEFLYGGGIYVASQVTWYPGLALLGPEIIQKSKDFWFNFKQKIIAIFK
tara:strand:- start:733 stop:978 length:246 start_codon:yes stop_codon:yes gene_type:complete